MGAAAPLSGFSVATSVGSLDVAHPVSMIVPAVIHMNAIAINDMMGMRRRVFTSLGVPTLSFG